MFFGEQDKIEIMDAFDRTWEAVASDIEASRDCCYGENEEMTSEDVACTMLDFVDTYGRLSEDLMLLVRNPNLRDDIRKIAIQSAKAFGFE